MSDTGDENPAPRSRESALGAAGAWVPDNSGTQQGGSNAVGAAGVAEAAAGLGQEERVQVEGPHGGLEDAGSEDGSDMELEAEVEGNVVGPHLPLLGARQLPAGGFHFIFLELVHSLLYRIYYNHHILMRPVSGQVLVRPRPQMGQRVPHFPVPLPLGEGAVAQEPQGVDDGDVAQQPEGPGEGAMAQEPEDQAEAEAKEEPVEEAAAQDGEEQVPGSRGRPSPGKAHCGAGSLLARWGLGTAGPQASHSHSSRLGALNKLKAG